MNLIDKKKTFQKSPKSGPKKNKLDFKCFSDNKVIINDIWRT